MKVFRGIHAAHAIVVFSFLFMAALPALMIPIVFPTQWRLVGKINRVWAKLFFALTFFPYKAEYRCRLDPTKQYVFCINHFSYLDIPTIGMNRIDSIFVGKSAMESIPFFGFMYRKLHITVNRDSLRSRYNTFVKSCKAVDEGKNLMIFPEGGILSHNPPKMARFKDGAFRTAIEKQIAIIPVTIPHNWIILPDSSLLPRWREVRVIYHEPIETKGLTLDDLPAVKQKTYEIIDAELKRHN